MLTFVYDAHKNNDKRVIGIAQLCLSAVLKIKAVYGFLDHPDFGFPFHSPEITSEVPIFLGFEQTLH